MLAMTSNIVAARGVPLHTPAAAPSTPAAEIGRALASNSITHREAVIAKVIKEGHPMPLVGMILMMLRDWQARWLFFQTWRASQCRASSPSAENICQLRGGCIHDAVRIALGCLILVMVRNMIRICDVIKNVMVGDMIKIGDVVKDVVVGDMVKVGDVIKNVMVRNMIKIGDVVKDVMVRDVVQPVVTLLGTAMLAMTADIVASRCVPLHAPTAAPSTPTTEIGWTFASHSITHCEAVIAKVVQVWHTCS
jgi:hypothetical protein